MCPSQMMQCELVNGSGKRNFWKLMWEKMIKKVLFSFNKVSGCVSSVHISQCHHLVALQETTSLQLQVANFILVPYTSTGQ